jgi:WD40 repeat protein
MVSSGMDARVVISDPEAQEVKRVLLGHQRGVYSFAYCPFFHCLLSAGFDRKVLVWDPYMPTPVGALNAHHTDLLGVLSNEACNQIITVCADKKIKVRNLSLCSSFPKLMPPFLNSRI